MVTGKKKIKGIFFFLIFFYIKVKIIIVYLKKKKKCNFFFFFFFRLKENFLFFPSWKKNDLSDTDFPISDNAD